MPITGEIQGLYRDREQTQPVFPLTKVKAISDDDGGLEEIGGQIPGQMSFADMERMRTDEREEDAS